MLRLCNHLSLYRYFYSHFSMPWGCRPNKSNSFARSSQRNQTCRYKKRSRQAARSPTACNASVRPGIVSRSRAARVLPGRRLALRVPPTVCARYEGMEPWHFLLLVCFTLDIRVYGRSSCESNRGNRLYSIKWWFIVCIAARRIIWRSRGILHGGAFVHTIGCRLDSTAAT